MQSKLDNGFVHSRMLNIERSNPAKRAISAMAKVDSKNHLCGKFATAIYFVGVVLKLSKATTLCTASIYNFAAFYVSYQPVPTASIAGLIYKSASGTDLLSYGLGHGGIH